MNCPACGADNREGANFCRMCGELIPEHPQDQPTVMGKDIDVVPKEPLASADDVTVPDKELNLEAKTATAAPIDGPPATQFPEVHAENLEAELPEGVDGEPEALSGVQAEGTSRGREPVPEEEPVEDPSDSSEMEVEVVEGDSDQPLPGTRLAAESPQIEELGLPTPPAAPGPTVPGEVEASPAKETETLPGEPVTQTTVTEAPAEANAEAHLADSVGEAKDRTALPEPIESGNLILLAPGTVIGGRLQIVGALDDEEDETLYLAHDLLRCWQCGFQDNEPDDAFCAQCGASRERRAQVRLLEVQNKEADPSGGEAVAARLSHEGRHFLLLAEPEVAPEAESGPKAPDVPQTIRLLVGQHSDAGQVRELDEDSLLALTLTPIYESRIGPVLGLFAVADGMGGHEGGEVASRMALQVLADGVLRSIVLPALADKVILEEEVINRLHQATVNANDAVYLARQKRGNDMGTTLTTALVRDDRLFLAHVGDCRAYRWSADGLQQLTTDHSLVASMIASGQATHEEIYTHPHRSVIYRCVGDQPVVEVDTDVVPLVPGDRIIVCCDGLWEMVRDEGIEDVMMQEADPQAACELLVNHANVAGGDDNISVIIVQVESV